MSRNTEGEFELVLGNKQLLSLFFLVVVLFAVFFSLGYMVGRSVAPPTTQAAQPAGTSPGPAVLPDRPAQQASGGEAAPPPPVTETQPARVEPAAREAAEPAPPAKPAAPEAQENAALVARQLHLQLAAVRVQADAEALVEALKKKGYPVVLHSETADGWHRVLVGPFVTERAAQEMRSQLEKDGYKSILRKP